MAYQRSITLTTRVRLNDEQIAKARSIAKMRADADRAEANLFAELQTDDGVAALRRLREANGAKAAVSFSFNPYSDTTVMASFETFETVEGEMPTPVPQVHLDPSMVKTLLHSRIMTDAEKRMMLRAISPGLDTIFKAAEAEAKVAGAMRPETVFSAEPTTWGNLDLGVEAPPPEPPDFIVPPGWFWDPVKQKYYRSKMIDVSQG